MLLPKVQRNLRKSVSRLGELEERFSGHFGFDDMHCYLLTNPRYC